MVQIVNQWTAKIQAAWNKTLESIIEVGLLLKAAKADLPHGEFLAMTRRQLPFGPRHAQRLMSIADNPRISNATRVSHLPCSVGTLYQLSKLPPEQFDALLADGKIHPEMRRDDVASLNYRRQLE